jgi:hypothetical protein
MLVLVLIVLISLIILLHYLCSNNQIIEYLDNPDDSDKNKNYQDYSNLKSDPKNGPLFLATKNAANISVLHTDVDALNKLKEQVSDLSGQILANSQALSTVIKKVTEFPSVPTNSKPK